MEAWYWPARGASYQVVTLPRKPGSQVTLLHTTYKENPQFCITHLFLQLWAALLITLDYTGLLLHSLIITFP